MKRKFARYSLKFFKSFFTTLCILYLLVNIISNKDGLAKIYEITFSQFGSFMILFCAVFFVRALEFSYILRILKVEISTLYSFCFNVVSTTLNLLPLSAGTLFRGHILKTYGSLPYARYVSLMSTIVLMTISAAGFLGLLSVILIASPVTDGMQGASSLELLAASVFLLFCTIFPLLLVHFPIRWLPASGGWIWGRLATMIEAWNQMTGPTMRVLLCASVAKLLIVSLRLWLCFSILSVDVDFLAAIMFATITSLLLVVNVTPGNFGLREILTGLIAQAFGIDFADGVLAASIDRVVSLIFLFISSIPSGIYINNNIQNMKASS